MPRMRHRVLQPVGKGGPVLRRHRAQPVGQQGAAGGQPGACGAARIERADGTTQVLTAKARVRWQAGDVLVIETAGGGGWGKPVAAGAEFA